MIILLIKKFLRVKRATVAIERANVAIQMIDDLIINISDSNDPVRELIADILYNRNNIPFVVTVYEAVQEVKSYRNGHFHS